MTAHACGFITRAGFTQSGGLAALSLAFRGRNRFALATAHTVRFPGLRRDGYPISPPGQLHVSQAFHMVSSSQLTRKTRLGLAHQIYAHLRRFLRRAWRIETWVEIHQNEFHAFEEAENC
jgi:hypothetical protein